MLGLIAFLIIFILWIAYVFIMKYPSETHQVDTSLSNKEPIVQRSQRSDISRQPFDDQIDIYHGYFDAKFLRSLDIQRTLCAKHGFTSFKFLLRKAQTFRKQCFLNDSIMSDLLDIPIAEFYSNTYSRVSFSNSECPQIYFIQLQQGQSVLARYERKHADARKSNHIFIKNRPLLYFNVTLDVAIKELRINHKDNNQDSHQYFLNIEFSLEHLFFIMLQIEKIRSYNLSDTCVYYNNQKLPFELNLNKDFTLEQKDPDLSFDETLVQDQQFKQKLIRSTPIPFKPCIRSFFEHQKLSFKTSFLDVVAHIISLLCLHDIPGCFTLASERQKIPFDHVAQEQYFKFHSPEKFDKVFTIQDSLPTQGKFSLLFRQDTKLFKYNNQENLQTQQSKYKRSLSDDFLSFLDLRHKFLHLGGSLVFPTKIIDNYAYQKLFKSLFQEFTKVQILSSQVSYTSKHYIIFSGYKGQNKNILELDFRKEYFHFYKKFISSYQKRRKFIFDNPIRLQKVLTQNK